MLFDAKAALAEILAATPATPATIATNTPTSPPLSQLSRVSQAGMPETGKAPAAPGEPSPRVVTVDKSAERPVTRPDGPYDYPYGFAVNGHPLTWTGRPVSREAWALLSPWERHGSTGMVWNGLTGAWEPVGPNTSAL